MLAGFVFLVRELFALRFCAVIAGVNEDSIFHVPQRRNRLLLIALDHVVLGHEQSSYL